MQSYNWLIFIGYFHDIWDCIYVADDGPTTDIDITPASASVDTKPQLRLSIKTLTTNFKNFISHWLKFNPLPTSSQ